MKYFTSKIDSRDYTRLLSDVVNVEGVTLNWVVAQGDALVLYFAVHDKSVNQFVASTRDTLKADRKSVV